MRCLVTGGAGFIGSYLVDRLLVDGHHVTVMDNLSTGRIVNVRHARMFRNEVQDWPWVMNLGRADWLFHLAAKADIVPSIEQPRTYHQTNVDGTVNALEWALKCGVKRFIYAASSSCYGDHPPIPTSEGAALDPRYPYALTKMVGEQYALHWMQVYGLPVVSLRLFNVYGPRHRTSGAYGAVMGVFLAQKANKQPLTVVGDGTQRRDFTHVSDVVQAMVRAAESDITGVFNVGSGDAHSINELVSLFEAPSVNIPKRPGEPDVTQANIWKIRQVLDWAPKMSFGDGVRDLLSRVEEWKTAPVWTPDTIAQQTKAWHKHLAHA
jgi:UDP-glucose 4-epimerase